MIEGSRLSPQQRHLWRLQQVDGSSPYRVECAARIEGALDTKVLTDALHDVFARHEILRTTFQPLREATYRFRLWRSAAQPSINEYDLSACDRAELKTRIERFFMGPGRCRLTLPPARSRASI